MRRGDRSIRLTVTALVLSLLIAAAAVGIADAGSREGEATGKDGLLEFTVGASFSPKVLQAARQTPIRLDAVGDIFEGDPLFGSSHPPAIREIRIETAALEIHTEGIPVCDLRRLKATETEVAEKVCGAALIGAGSAVAELAFLEQGPIDVTAPLLVFNGGTEHGKTVLLLHTYFSMPISEAVVTKVTAKDLPGGRFGTFATAEIPQITGGYSSIIRFHLTINRNVAGRHPISATCARGKIRVHVEGEFEDGSRTTTELSRPCGD